MSDDKQKQCFIIGPIGSPDDPQYDRAVGRLQQIFEPAATENGLIPKRSDQDSEPGRITDQIIKDIYYSEVVIADLWPDKEDKPNPNVMYELGIAHSFDKKVVSFMKEGQQLPFDIAGFRCVSWDSSFIHLNSAKSALANMIKSVLAMKSPYSPVVSCLQTTANIKTSENGEPLLDLMEYFDRKFSSLHREIDLGKNRMYSKQITYNNDKNRIEYSKQVFNSITSALLVLELDITRVDIFDLANNIEARVVMGDIDREVFISSSNIIDLYIKGKQLLDQKVRFGNISNYDLFVASFSMINPIFLSYIRDHGIKDMMKRYVNS